MTASRDSKQTIRVYSKGDNKVQIADDFHVMIVAADISPPQATLIIKGSITHRESSGSHHGMEVQGGVAHTLTIGETKRIEIHGKPYSIGLHATGSDVTGEFCDLSVSAGG